MKIFNAVELSVEKSEIRQLDFHINEDFESYITTLESTDITLMAEQPSENNLVLETAVKHWLGYGLYYPKITELDQDLLRAHFPKIFLLKPNDPSVEEFSKFGQVVFDRNEYQHNVAQLVYFGSFFDDAD